MSTTGHDYTKPLPKLEGFAGEFYEWCRRGELRFQRCSNCQTWRHVPREMCATCSSLDWSWERSSGKGVVFVVEPQGGVPALPSPLAVSADDEPQPELMTVRQLLMVGSPPARLPLRY